MSDKDSSKKITAQMEDESSLSNRRAHDRVMVNFEVDYKCDDTFLFAYVTDLSAMGIFLQTKTPRPPGTQINLHFAPPGGPEINVEGLVMWVNPYRPNDPDNLNPGMGIQFIDMEPAMRDRMLNLVKKFAYLTDDETTLGHS